MTTNMTAITLLALASVGLFASFDRQTATNALIAETATIKWLSWNEMVEAQRTEPRKVIVDVYTDWCGWCKHMDKTTFINEKVAQYVNQKFYAVKLDAETRESFKFQSHTFNYVQQGKKGINELAYSLLDGKLSYPSIVYLNENFARIVISPGYKNEDAMLKELKYIGEGIYSTKTWEEYSNGR